MFPAGPQHRGERHGPDGAAGRTLPIQRVGVLGEPERGWGGARHTGAPRQWRGKAPLLIRGSNSEATLGRAPQPPSSDPSALPSRASMAPLSKHAVTFFRTVTSSREERGHIPSAPGPRLQTHCAALIFSKKRAFPLQHALCGKLRFLLTSGTNSVWHVWRDCSPFEPLPC